MPCQSFSNSTLCNKVLRTHTHTTHTHTPPAHTHTHTHHPPTHPKKQTGCMNCQATAHDEKPHITAERREAAPGQTATDHLPTERGWAPELSLRLQAVCDVLASSLGFMEPCSVKKSRLSCKNKACCGSSENNSTAHRATGYQIAAQGR